MSLRDGSVCSPLTPENADMTRYATTPKAIDAYAQEKAALKRYWDLLECIQSGADVPREEMQRAIDRLNACHAAFMAAAALD